MLTIPPEELTAAFAMLEPSHRALLELSLHREVADPALAELLRTDATTVSGQRTESLEQLATILNVTPGDVELALIAFWRGEPAGEVVEAEVVEGEPEAEEVEPGAEELGGEEPEAETDLVEAEELSAGAEAPPAAWSAPVASTPPPDEPERGSRRGFWIVVTALAALGLVLVLLLAGGGDDGDEEPANGTPAPAERPAGPVELRRVLGSGEVTGTARIVERGGRPRLVLRLAGLAEAPYAAWLYDSIGDARRLATFRGPDPLVRAPLPEGYERYRLLDISREPDDGNPNHSGESVLRVAIEDLVGG